MNNLERGEQTLEQTAGFLSSLWHRFQGFLPTLLLALVVFFVGLMLTKILGKLVTRTMNRANVDITASSFGSSLVRILTDTLLVVICLSIVGVPMSSIVAIVGAAGLAVGLALQNSLSNLAGGFIILFAKPFQAGDYICIGKEEGTVASVSILYTKLVTRDNRTIYVPNGTISSGEVINLSERGSLRVEIPLSIAYSANFEQARAVLLTALAEEPMIFKEPAPKVLMSGYGDSAIQVTVMLWVKSTDSFSISAIVWERAKQALDDAGIEIPFPQICVHSMDK